MRLCSTPQQTDRTVKEGTEIDDDGAADERDRSGQDLECGIIVLKKYQYEICQCVVTLTMFRIGVESPIMKTTAKIQRLLCQVAYTRKAINT